VRKRGVLDVGVVGRVEDDHGVARPGPRDPGLEVRARGDGARGVVRRAEVDEVDALGRRARHEAVRLVAGQVEDPRIAPVGAARTGTPSHHVGVDVDRVDRIRHRDARVRAEDLLDVPAVLLAAVRDEDLVGRDLDATRPVVVLHDRVEQEVVALVGSVAAKALLRRELRHGRAHRLHDGRGEGKGHVADPEADHVRLGVRLLEGRHATPDLGKEVAGLELPVVLVDVRHGRAG